MQQPLTDHAVTHWQRVKVILDEALEQAGEARAAFVAQACAGDLALQAEVERLLSYVETHDAATNTEWLPHLPQTMPEQLGPYRLVRELGHGGMGTVYLAERADAQYRQQVALKLVRHSFGLGPQRVALLERFRNERQILAALNHPNIARLLDGGQTPDGAPYLVMEYIEGEPLDAYCRQRNLPLTERLQLFRQVCAAVHYAHQHLVIHRDLKPSNILVTTSQEARGGTPKLLDFGIAKLLSPELAAQTLHETAPEQRLLTPAYASPEQVRGETVTTASDVYSLGVLLYELLTSHSPYRVNSQASHELIRAVCDEEPEKPSTVEKRRAKEKETLSTAAVSPSFPFSISPSQLRGDLDNIVLKALRKEPARRYGSVEQLSEDLRRYLAGLPVSAHKDSWSYRASKFVRRNKVGVAATVLLVLVLAAGITTTIIQRNRAERRFNDVRQLANALFELDDLIYKLSGATPARKLLVEKALLYLDSLAREAGNDRALQRELARSYLRIAEVQGNPATPNLGDREGALNSYQKALSISQQLVAAKSSDEEARQTLANSYEGVADLLQAKYDLQGALAHYRLALAAESAMSAPTLAKTAIQQNLALLYHKLGTVQGNPLYPNVGDQAGARENYQKCLEIYAALAAADRANPRHRHTLAMQNNSMGDMLKAAGDSAGAEKHFRQAIALAEAITQAHPNDAQYRRSLSIGYTRLARLLDENKRAAEAFALQSKALALVEALAKADTDNRMFQRDLNIACNWLGTFQAHSGDPAGALPVHHRALAVAASLAAAAPNDPDAQYDLAVTHKRMADTLALKKDTAAARESYHRAIAMLEKLAAASPDNENLKNTLARTQTALASLKL
jgi:eukaryotic-like serine/threonine-protein kinase